MNLFADLHQFHFLRPHFLWLLIPAALLCWGLARTILNSGQLQKIVDAELLPYLLLRGGARRPWLFSLIFALLAGTIVALAGPTWRKLPTPVFSSQDALVILLDLSPSMMATDLSPNRLTRARLKILDILRQRQDGLTALVAYGGEAHVVTPLTEDTATIANLVPALSPSIIPVPGSNIEMAVETAIRLLKDGAAGRGQLLAVTDGIDEMALDAVAKLVADAQVELNILAVGSGEGSPIPRGDGGGFITDDNGAIIIANFDARELARLARGSGGRFARISVDDSDIAKLLPDDETPEQAQLTEREFDQWREEGPWLVLLLLPLAALLFRRGALACLPLPLSLGALLLLPPQQSQAFEWQDLWQREDQQAEQLLQQGEAAQAAETFKDPQWRGTANYRAGNYPAAEKDFSVGGDAEALYNLGNSLTQQGLYNEAIATYDEALERQPQFPDAEHNREIAKKLRDLQKQQQQQQSQQDQQQSGQQQQQSGDSQQQSQDQQQQQSQQDAGSQQQSDAGDQQPSEQQAQNGDQQEKEQDQQQPDRPQQGEDQRQQGEQQQAGAEDSPLDPETQQALDQWLRQIPDDPAGLMREKFKYESLQRRRAYRSGEWQPPENGATQRW
ncbi:VWA domain-containing protein [Microbulbifer magnicolonia]|uniref:VWA domain-containing protein n=1 Tax=Microbulbifer magnicolonia TaxID=3109744 RepID=UPI002B4125A7|nr:VWA domain-containing protein [Microbulbifer sp. GG15]